MHNYTLKKNYIIRQAFDGHISLVQDYDKYGNLSPIEEFRAEFSNTDSAELAIVRYCILNNTELFNLVILPAYYCQDNR